MAEPIAFRTRKGFYAVWWARSVLSLFLLALVVKPDRRLH